jgi:hypothetical protein
MKRLCVILLLAALICLGSSILVAAESTITLDQLIANHIKSLGSPEALAQANARQIDGVAHFEVVVGGGGKLDGKAALVSDARKMKMGMLFNDPAYSGEVFTSNGDKVAAKSMKTGMRSIVGGFVYDHSQLMREGLIGGALSSGWALLDVKGRNAKLTFDGFKKVNDRQLYQLTYRPKKNSGDLDIKLFLDENFRHVMSVYSVTIAQRLGVAPDPNNPAAPVGASETASARQDQTRYLLEETYADFKQNNGLTLPTKYTLRLTYEPGVNAPMQVAGAGTIGLTNAMNSNKPQTTIWRYDVTLDNFVNAPVPEKVFAIN